METRMAELKNSDEREKLTSNNKHAQDDRREKLAQPLRISRRLRLSSLSHNQEITSLISTFVKKLTKIIFPTSFSLRLVVPARFKRSRRTIKPPSSLQLFRRRLREADEQYTRFPFARISRRGIREADEYEEFRTELGIPLHLWLYVLWLCACVKYRRAINSHEHVYGPYGQKF